ncbi:MAG: ECF transporter S component [Eubacterium sp.]|nr:ECF transporter S component [Eubacterium sp.]
MKVKSITFTGLFTALIFIFTFTFKIPAGNTLGYAHLGDMFIIISAWMLGGKYAPFAAGLGAMLADFASGFAVWMLPTFIVKFVMAATIGIIAEKLFDGNYKGYLIGTLIGAILHIAGYSLAWYVLAGSTGAASAFVPLCLQTFIGVVLGNIIVFRLEKTATGQKLQIMARGELV